MKTNRLLVALAVLAVMVSCGGEKQAVMTVYDGFALGTFYSVTVKGDVPDDLHDKIDSVFDAANASMSVFNPNSLLSRLNRNETDIPDDDIIYCIELARGASELSGGKYDITIQPLAEAYGFRDSEQIEDVNVDSLLRFVGYRKVRIEKGKLVKEYPEIRIDLNSVAKGYTVDLVAGMLDKEGIKDYLVNIGGEIFCRGTNKSGNKWTLGIETPTEGNYVQGASTECRLTLTGMGVATSGNYRNFHADSKGRKYTHIIDPLTGDNTESNLLSATVVAETCALADAYGTMFIALGMDGAMKLLEEHPDIAALLIYVDDAGEMKRFVSAAMSLYTVD